MIVASVDDEKVITNLNHFRRDIGKSISKRLLDIGIEILRLSQFEVPHDLGTLQNSGTVEVIDDAVVVGYHTPYAARLHEHPEYNFQKGRKGKYLEDPIKRNEKALGIKYAVKVRQDVMK